MSEQFTFVLLSNKEVIESLLDSNLASCGLLVRIRLLNVFLFHYAKRRLL